MRFSRLASSACGSSTRSSASPSLRCLWRSVPRDLRVVPGRPPAVGRSLLRAVRGAHGLARCAVPRVLGAAAPVRLRPLRGRIRRRRESARLGVEGARAPGTRRGRGLDRRRGRAAAARVHHHLHPSGCPPGAQAGPSPGRGAGASTGVALATSRTGAARADAARAAAAGARPGRAAPQRPRRLRGRVQGAVEGCARRRRLHERCQRRRGGFGSTARGSTPRRGDHVRARGSLDSSA